MMYDMKISLLADATTGLGHVLSGLVKFAVDPPEGASSTTTTSLKLLEISLQLGHTSLCLVQGLLRTFLGRLRSDLCAAKRKRILCKVLG